MNVADRNPCPQCGKTPSLMAGCNVEGVSNANAYLVCWSCKIIKAMGDHPWVTVTKKKKPKHEWRKHTPHHWSMIIDGQQLDYWPTRRKWRFEGKTMRGDVEAFIRGLKL